jgi:signal transduction histidine kinase
MGLLLIPNDAADQDYFINLVLPLCGQAMWSLNEKKARGWVITFSAFCLITMILYYGDTDGISFGLTYVAGCVLVSVLSAATLSSDNAQKKSRELLQELTLANEKLVAYASKVEELAVAEERNRLARELHDSVTQIIFGMTLSAQAARILIDRDPQRASLELDNLQGLSQNALSEMRTLIQELHPQSSIKDGLVPAIRNLTARQFANTMIQVNLQLTGTQRYSERIEMELFRIIQEALNNISKHAQAKTITISMDLEKENLLHLEIEDDGIGFDIDQVKSLPGHLGLTSIQERARNIGGTLTIDSHPGDGTRIIVEIELEKEIENAG